MQTIFVQTRLGPATVSNIFPVLDHSTGNVTA